MSGAIAALEHGACRIVMVAPTRSELSGAGLIDALGHAVVAKSVDPVGAKAHRDQVSFGDERVRGVRKDPDLIEWHWRADGDQNDGRSPRCRSTGHSARDLSRRARTQPAVTTAESRERRHDRVTRSRMPHAADLGLRSRNDAERVA